MRTKQGDISLLHDPVAQALLRSKAPARLAYVWTDGTPRVVPVWFHWTGEELVLGTPPDAPKVKALSANPHVALTIDTETFPPRALLIRGTAQMDAVDSLPEYAAAATRYLGEEAGQAWVAQVGGMFPQMMRIVVRPEWVAILDFETRFPAAIEKAMAAA